MTTIPRPLVVLVERLVLAAWAVVEVLATAAVLLVEARRGVRPRERRRPGTASLTAGADAGTHAGAHAGPRVRPGPTRCAVGAAARTVDGSLTV